MNASNVAVGSVNAGSDQRGVIYSGGSATIITQTTTNGSFFLTAFGINDSGRIVGQGIDPQNAARNVGIVYDIGQSMAFEVGALPGANGALAFGVVPFLYDGTNTYRLQDLIPGNSGWDLSMNTSSSAQGISEDGVIVGTGVHNGETHAYAMVPVSPTPTPTPTATPTATPGITPRPRPTPHPRPTPR